MVHNFYRLYGKVGFREQAQMVTGEDGTVVAASRTLRWGIGHPLQTVTDWAADNGFRCGPTTPRWPRWPHLHTTRSDRA